MNCLAIDVCYVMDRATVVGVWFSLDNDQEVVYEAEVSGIADYVSGQFYKRELPCILALLDKNELSPDCILVDGYVYLENDKPGLGKYLYDALGGEVIVIGVAKNSRGQSASSDQAVYRGDSKKPLYVTCEGIALHEAKAMIKKMDGQFRMPNAIKLADTLCRSRAKEMMV